MDLEKKKFVGKEKRAISYSPFVLVGVRDYGGHCVWHHGLDRARPAELTVALCYDEELQVWCPVSGKNGPLTLIDTGGKIDSVTGGKAIPWRWWWNMTSTQVTESVKLARLRYIQKALPSINLLLRDPENFNRFNFVAGSLGPLVELGEHSPASELVICETVEILSSRRTNHAFILSEPSMIDFLLQKLTLATPAAQTAMAALTSLATNPEVAAGLIAQGGPRSRPGLSTSVTPPPIFYEHNILESSLRTTPG